MRAYVELVVQGSVQLAVNKCLTSHSLYIRRVKTRFFLAGILDHARRALQVTA